MRVDRGCLICGSIQFDFFVKKNGFSLGRCLRCSLLQVTDDLSKVCLKDYYDQEFFDETYDWLQKPAGKKKEYQKFNYRLTEIEKFKPGKGNVLDIGCSFGHFLDCARSRGWTPVGVEISEYAARFAKETLKLNVHVADVSEADLPEGHFDAVTLWNVLEHLDDPVEELEHLNRLMKKAGLLVFTTGDVDSYLRKLQGLRWRSFIPPIHVANYGPRSVKSLLEKTGFRLLSSSVALPREELLSKLHVINSLKKIKFSDKMLIYAQKV